MPTMEFSDVVRRRRMIRRYDDRPVDPTVLDRILANALHAPSAGFSQGWAFLVLEGHHDLERFWEATTPPEVGPNEWLDGMRTAPVVVVPLANKSTYLERYAEQDKGWTDQQEVRWVIPYWYTDTAMAALLMLLTVTDEGLGACFFGIQREQHPAFRDAFGVPAEYTPIGAITIGHRAKDTGAKGSVARGRRTDVIHRGRWQG
jgi:nitroreductase